MATPKKPTKKVAKKTETESTEQAASKPAQTAPAAPLIDAAAHAQTAAALLANRAKQPQTPTTGESAAFKQLKAGLAKPPLGANSPLGGGSNFPKTGHTQGFNKQPMHRQAFNSGANRTGVPRRTSGG